MARTGRRWTVVGRCGAGGVHGGTRSARRTPQLSRRGGPGHRRCGVALRRGRRRHDRV